MRNQICLLAALFLTSSLNYANGARGNEFEVVLKQADQNNATVAGKRYMEQFQNAIYSKLAPAMHVCNSQPDTVEPALIVLIIASDGKVKRASSTPSIPYGECIVSKLRLPVSVPPPPHDDWAIAIGVANHNNAGKNAPPDKSVRVEDASAVAYDKAIAPYVAKARATYPGARKRFLAGLPPGYRFAVSYRLLQKDDASREFRFEDVIVEVNQIKDGIVHGTIANKLGIVTNYHEGQAVTFPESKVMNWLFIRPDGSEEGNILGKFLDHYKPQ